MKKLIFAVIAVLILAAGAGAAWWKFGRPGDPLANAKRFMDKGDVRSATIELRNAVRLDPANPEAHLRLGVLQLQAGDPVAAEKELKAARTAGAKVPELNVLIAQSYLQQGRNKELLAEFLPPAPTAELTSQLLILRSFAEVATNNPLAAQSSVAAAERFSPNSANPPLAAARLAIGRGDLAGAEQKVELALQLDPHRADALLLKGQILNGRGSRSAALDTLTEAVDAAPKYAAARLERANLLITLNDDARAKIDVDLVLADQPNSAAGTYLKAALLARAGDNANADLAFQKLSGVMQRFPRAYYFQAIVKYNLGQMEQATDSANRYLQRSPSDPVGVKLLARILLASGRGDRALETLLSAVRSGTADADTLDLLGRAYAITGKPVQATQSFDRAVAMAPENAEIMTHLASARLGQVDAAGTGTDIARGLQLAPQGADPAETAVVSALATGDVDGVRAALAKLRAASGNTETVGLLNGTLLMMTQDLDGARGQFEELIEANPAQVRARVALARVLLMQNRPADAEQALNQALVRNPADPTALGAMIQLLLGRNQAARAVVVMETALAAAPANEAYLLTLSDLYIRVGASDRSLELLDKPIPGGGKAGPPSLGRLGARGRALFAAQQFPAARLVYQQILKQLPGDIVVIRQLLALENNDKDYASERVMLNEALATRPGDTALLRLLVGVELSANGEPAAMALIARMQADPVNHDGARTLTADYYLFEKRYREAAEAYATAQHEAPSSALVQSLATSWFSAGQPQKAIDALTDWLSGQPNDVDAARSLATLHIIGKHAELAQPLLEHVLELQPSDAVALNNLAWIYQQKRDPRALAMGRRAFLLQPSPQSADTLGWSLVLQGNAAEALPLLSQAAAEMGGSPDVQYHYAAALKAVGRNDEAAKILGPLVEQPLPFDGQAAARQLLDELK